MKNQAHERLLNAAITLLNLKGFRVWRHDTSLVIQQWTTKDGKTHRGRRWTGTAGTWDIFGWRIRDAKFCAFEIKIGRDFLSQAQVDFYNQVFGDGCLAHIVRDNIDGLQAWIARNE